jgi:hypothetical protein
MSTFKFTIGCDPEIFVKDRATGKPVSAHDLVPGSKKAPHKVSAGAVQPDGLAAEFNTNPVPIDDFSAFNNNIVGVLSELRSIIPSNLQIEPSPTVFFDKDYYESLPEEAKELGCDPDYCAYSIDPSEPNPRPDGDSGQRSAAGHIHVGWGADIPVDHPDHVEVCRAFIRNLDVFVGLGMTCIDSDTERRKLYGKAGAYRPKSYGVEYRTPSNAWILNTPLRRFIHGLVSRAVKDMQSTTPQYLKAEREGVDIQSIINSGDVSYAKTYLSTLGITLPKIEEVSPEEAERIKAEKEEVKATASKTKKKA